MSVWPRSISPAPPLAGSDGVLVSVSIHVDPRYLESLLEALAQVDFPINPQIYHEAALIYALEDGREISQPTTLVEFPAFAGRLPSLQNALAAFGFDPESMAVTDMLEEIRGEDHREPASAEAPRQIVRRKRAGLWRAMAK